MILMNNGNNKIGFKSYVNIGRNIIKKSLGITPVLFAPPFDDFSTNNLNLLSRSWYDSYLWTIKLSQIF